ncbi:hypothetical protein [Fictibacillus gelatini]|uniref:hypothetical protein n=1 Tax=Fictibacillus gelatini TaxID=225985 RepID=UPI0004108C73|nr:hypothetical protein [Fictibacillus gelatini]
MAVTATGRTKTKNLLLNFIRDGQYTMNGKKYRTPIFKTDITGDIVTVYLYLDDSVSGTVTKFELLDPDGETFDDSPKNITKTAANGLLVYFQYKLSITSI